jgi:Holliday junction DNA helicase RuvA
MFAYLKGNLAFKNNENAVVDVGGVGYSLQIPFSTYRLLPDIDNEVKLYTYMAVREDNISLFGFFSNEEKRLFEQLISVSGIGPKLAVGVLSDIAPAEFSLAVITDDVNRLTKISGIGKKTAQRMIIELKDKMKKEDISDNVDVPNVQFSNNSNAEEAIAALQVLGYSNKDAVSMVNSVFKEDMQVEEIIKLALKNK